MRRGSWFVSLFLFPTLWVAGPERAVAQNAVLRLVSDETWRSQVWNGSIYTDVGPAQKYCLNATAPPFCPPGATLFGYNQPGWSANLASIPGAAWIWRPGVTGATLSADLAEVRFLREFMLPGAPVSGHISLAVDSAARVIVNGLMVGSYGSVTDRAQAAAAQSNLITFNITNRLVAGRNTIMVIAQNGSGGLAGCQSSCTYAQNPAGVVFGVTVEFPPPAGTYYGEGSKPSNPTVVRNVNTATGNVYLRATDLWLRGRVMPFEFIRHYNELDPYSGPFGEGWTHSYNVRLFVGTTSITLKERDGQEVLFAACAAGPCAPITTGVFDTLTRLPGGDFTLTRRDQTRFTFTPAGLLSSIVDRNGNTIQLQYDGAGNLVRIIDTGARPFTLTYNAFNRVTSLADAAGRTVRYAYDGANRLSSITDPAGGVTRYLYDGSNRLISLVNARGITVAQYSHDASNRLLRQTDAAGFSKSYVYSGPPSNTTVETDSAGRITRFTYDNPFRLTSLANALGGTYRYTYDAQNQRLTETDPNGSTTRFSYDARGNRIAIENALGHRISLVYDAQNNVISSTDGAGRTTTFTYDRSGNRVSRQDGLGNTTLYSYDTRGSLIQETDPNGRRTNYTYDAALNLLTVTDARGGVTAYSYDQLGNTALRTNARFSQTAYEYDILNRLVKLTDPLGNATRYGWDAVGNLTSVTHPNNRTIRYSYDARNLRTAIIYPNGFIARFFYDAPGRRASRFDAAGTSTYTYDAVDRLTSDTRGGKTVTHAYDAVGNRTSITYPDLKSVSYSYDAANRMERVTDWLGRVTSYTYNAADQILAIAYPDATNVNFSYDAAGRLVRAGNNYAALPAPAPSTNFLYVLDPAGNRIQITNGLGAVTNFGYDAVNQLTSISSAAGVTTYAYDLAGNRTLRTSPAGAVNYTYDAADRLISAGATAYLHDVNGNLIRRATGANIVSYAYDADNRLTRVSGPGIDSSFTYDADGNRVRQRTLAGTYDYVLDIARPLVSVVQETGPDGALSYVRGRGLISLSAAGLDRFYHYDALGTVRALSQAAPLESYAIDAWGVNQTPPAPGPATRNRFRYIGEQQDPETGLYFLRARYYDADLGRFLTKDGFPGYARSPLSHNPYIYGRNNPLSYTDRSGRYPEEGDSDFGYGDYPVENEEGSQTDLGLEQLDPPSFPFEPPWP
jgi:RHS repeat-associated protein